MRKILSVAEIVTESENRHCTISEIVIEREQKLHEAGRKEIWDRMAGLWEIMKQSMVTAERNPARSLSGLVGEENKLLVEYMKTKGTLAGEGTVQAAARAMGVAALNASMGKIVACPTAGSCGIAPAVLLTTAEKTGAGKEKIIAALFTAAGIGMVIDETASTSGAEGGCQVECGAASCMAAAAAVELAGGTPVQAAHAGAIALKSVIGLVCDPVAGLVEVPCVKRNAIGAGNALLAADMALAGIKSVIPLDEVIGAAAQVGRSMPDSLKETAEGGLAATPIAREIERRLGVTK